MPIPIEGPILDALKAVRDIIWWEGFQWGAIVGGAAGLLIGAILSRGRT